MTSIINFHLSSNNRLNFVSCNKNLLGEETFTKYSILKYKDKVLLLYKNKHFNSEEIISINQIKEIASEYREEDIAICYPNEILIGKDIVGTYNNGLTFKFENIISKEEDKIEEEKVLHYLQRGNVY